VTYMAEDNKPQGIIFNIQRYSIHDGPGIRTTVFFKGCPLRCFWCQNPESQVLVPQTFFYRERCTRCGECVKVCPTGASHLLDTSSEIDRDKCITCGKCAEVCPNEARKPVGTYMTVDEVIREVLKDARFYANSGGGVTLSGGEPLLQPEFASALLEKCKFHGLHTALETCGYAPWSAVEQVLRNIDFVLHDIKHVDEKKHITGTGVSNRLIIENARKIARLKPMRVRVPLIPGFNDSEQDILEIARFVRSELGAIPVDLLPYNKMGESKYKLLDRAATPKELQEEVHLQSLRDIISREITGTADQKA